MAQIDRFMIAPINSGLTRDVKPWLIPDDAFTSLTDCYVFRGRVRKRFGAVVMNQSVDFNVQQLYTRLRINIGTVASYTIPGGATQLQIGQAFSVGNDIFTIYQLGNNVLTYSTNGAATATINTTVNPNTVTFTGEPNGSTVYYYPSTPVMGFITYENDQLNNEPLFAFDTQFAYQFTSGAWSRLAAENQPGAATWSGSDSQFMWGYTYRGLLNSDYFLFATNFNFPTVSSSNYDYMRYWDGTAWNYLYPVLNQSFRLITARIIVPFKNRLLCLNTVENNEGTKVGTTAAVTGNFTVVIGGYIYTPGQAFVVGSTVYTIISNTPGPQPMGVAVINNQVAPPTATFDVSTGTIVITGNNNNPSTDVYYLGNPAPTTSTIKQYVNRCRFSQNGSPVNSNSWLDTLGTRGGFIDAPVKEQIISSEFLKDRLIVYFETSTWELAYTGNDVQPFRWQQINTELGVEATFSTVPFDKAVLGVGNVGVHACNGANVERVDQKIPDEVFKIRNDNQGVQRVYGIRDYYVEMVYWTFPSDVERGITYPNRVLVYNYKTGSWAFNIDSITAFGYFQQQNVITWQTEKRTWEQIVDDWQSGILQSHFRQVIAGNQEGFTFIIVPDLSFNCMSLQITKMDLTTPNFITLTVINHNLDADNPDYILIENIVGVTGVNGNVYSVYSVVDANNFVIQCVGASGIYAGGGIITRISNIDIQTKQYNFYVQDGVNSYINKVDFYVEKTSFGQVVVDYSVSSSTDSLLQDGSANGTLTGTGILETSAYALYPQENFQARVWHPIYPFAEGECIQLHIYMNDAQMKNLIVSISDFELHAMTFYTSPTGRLQ